jgi:molecular chaperone DnaK (HSP70)
MIIVLPRRSLPPSGVRKNYITGVPRLSQSTNKVDEQEDKQLIIGFDFGTTFSGIAYGFTSTPDADPICITDWPGREGHELKKVPTLMRYLDDGTFQWGYKVDPTSTDKIEGIKLLLDPSQSRDSLALNLVGTHTVLKRLGKKPVEVAGDYIREVYKHAMAKIEDAWPSGYISGFKKTFVLSVPAIWSDMAKDLTVKVSHPL